MSSSSNMNIWSLPDTEEKACAFLQQHGILPDKMKCKNGHEMKLYFHDCLRWRCNIRQCKSCVFLRVGTWLADSQIPLVTAVRFIYCWSEELTSIAWCQRQLNMSSKTTIDWNCYMREICIDALAKRPVVKIGGRNQIVHIDESLITRRKIKAGCTPPQQWIFGGICWETNECFLETASDRSQATFFDAIIRNVADGTTIYSNTWKTYHSTELEESRILDLMVEHRFNFIDPGNDEVMWSTVKGHYKRHRGTAQNQLESYMAEFMWRKMIHQEDDCFTALLQDIKFIWPPETQQQ